MKVVYIVNTSPLPTTTVQYSLIHLTMLKCLSCSVFSLGIYKNLQWVWWMREQMKRNLFLLIQIKKTSRWIRNACFIIFLSNGFFLLIHLLFALFSVYLWYLLNCLKSRVIFSEKEINKCTNVWPDKRNWAELVEIYLVQTTTLAECKLHIIYTNNLFILLFCFNIPYHRDVPSWLI